METNSKKNLARIAIFGLGLTLAACSSSDDTTDIDNNQDNTTEYKWSTNGGLKACDHLTFNADGTDNINGTQIGNGDQEFVFTGNQTLKKGTYTLKGWVYIADGATLTIEPGTVIKGDKTTMASLIAERGGKLIAKGTSTEPIVFTSAQQAGSRRPGDWGGVILCGKAPNNQNEMQIEGGPRTKHGGTDPSDNSGVLSYVRIEFAGYPFKADQEINGLTLGSIGSGTQIDHIQVSYSNDDSYEWFGGTNILLPIKVGTTTSIQTTASRVLYSTDSPFVIPVSLTPHRATASKATTMPTAAPYLPTLLPPSAT